MSTNDDAERFHEELHKALYFQYQREIPKEGVLSLVSPYPAFLDQALPSEANIPKPQALPQQYIHRGAVVARQASHAAPPHDLRACHIECPGQPERAGGPRAQARSSEWSIPSFPMCVACARGDCLEARVRFSTMEYLLLSCFATLSFSSFASKLRFTPATSPPWYSAALLFNAPNQLRAFHFRICKPGGSGSEWRRCWLVTKLVCMVPPGGWPRLLEEFELDRPISPAQRILLYKRQACTLDVLLGLRVKHNKLWNSGTPVLRYSECDRAA